MSAQRLMNLELRVETRRAPDMCSTRCLASLGSCTDARHDSGFYDSLPEQMELG